MLRPLRAVAILGAAVAVFVVAGSCAGVPSDPATVERSHAAFRDVAKVLRHPRCLNCHTVTDFPRVGDDRRRHPQNVVRGDADHGVVPMECGTCHRDANQDLVHLPGAPHWGLAPLSMGWEGLDDHELAHALIDRERNGDRSLDDLLRHMGEDPLVLWGWDPGRGRAPVPMPHSEFIAAVQTWIDTGAHVPPPGPSSRFTN